MTASSYDQIVAANIRAARARAGLDQVVVVERMRALGFATWHRQTMGKVERGERRLLGAEELLGLAEALETSVFHLMKPADDAALVRFPAGGTISARSVSLSVLTYNDQSVSWRGADPEFSVASGDMAAQVFLVPKFPAPPQPSEE